ncbi:NAD(P)H-quinone oxidoreductase [Georgenia sp. EYE_87]|uniref:NAD(P)H-quinone oxidoreductase n=1 Tax=Georgenia sp. EYE_87 TaxID=2853448 RepID=UPI002005626F|nr:NAD(P)H-quinone oxidoreductase [Georgenia sp. EYE_87]MCK6210068.1 NAD(P)H-quinone oxidoreductase [Georgenia sp. EYE_87]
MYAITMDCFGGPDVLRWSEVDDLVPAEGEIVIDVAATALNRADTLQRQGLYPPPPGSSEILGLECSGVISSVGPGVDGWHVGQEVCALLAGGGYAEKVAVPAEQVMRIPAGIDLVTAAALPEAACTLWSNMVMQARLTKGEILLVHGGAGGLGTMAIQIGVALGCTVAVTAGSAAKLALCRELGATILVNYNEEDFVDRVREATDGHGADVILDVLGASYLARNVDVLALDGRLAVIGIQGGTVAELDLRALMMRRGALIATNLRSRPVLGKGSKAAIVAAVQESLWPLVEAGAVVPTVGATRSVRDASQVHAESANGMGPGGKIVMTMG